MQDSQRHDCIEKNLLNVLLDQLIRIIIDYCYDFIGESKILEYEYLANASQCMISNIKSMMDGRIIISSVDYDSIIIYDPMIECVNSAFFMETYSILCFDTFADGKIILSCGNGCNNLIKMFDPMNCDTEEIYGSSHLTVRNMEKINVADTSVCTSIRVLSQELFVCGFDNGTLKIWNLLKRESEHILDSHTGAINCIQIISLLSSLIVSGSDDGTLKIWNYQTGTLKQTLEGHRASISCCAVFPDDRICSGSDDGTLKIWNIGYDMTNNSHCYQCELTLNLPGIWTDEIYSCAILPDEHIISGEISGIIKIWNSRTGECVKTLSKHADCVKDFTILPNRKIISASEKEILVWC